MTSPEIEVKIDRADAEGSNRHGPGSRGRDLNRTGSGELPSEANAPAAEDPPSRLISQFLEQQQSAGQMVLDMDMEMDEFRKDTRRAAGLPPLPLHGKQGASQNLSRGQSPLPSPGQASSGIGGDGMSREMRRVSFNMTAHHQRKSTEYNDLGELTSDSDSEGGSVEHADGEGSADDERRTGGLFSRRFQSYRDSAEVVRCTSNAAYDRMPTISKSRTKRFSRLMDPPPEPKSTAFGPMSGQLKSGLLGKSAELEDDEYDPFFDEDLPDEYKKNRIGCCVVIEWISLFLIIGGLFCSLLIPELRNRNLWRLKLWKWDVMVLVVICGRLVSGWGIRMIVFFIERNFMLRKRVLYFVYGLRNAVRRCIWLGLVLFTWHLLFDQRVEAQEDIEFIKYVTSILECFLVAAVVWLIKTLMVKVLASSFHVNAYFDRIQETLFNQFVIEKLSGPPSFDLHRKEDDEISISDLQRFPNAGAMFHSAELKGKIQAHSPKARSERSFYLMSGNLKKSGSGAYSMRASGPIGKKKDKRGITIDHLHKLNPRNVSAWNMKRLMNVVRWGALTTLDEEMENSAYVDDATREITSEVEAKAAARKIFRNVARPPARYIYFEDLLRFMEEDDAIKTMGLFEGALESERISKSSLKNWVVNAFRGRRALALTINDTKSAVNKLHQIVNGLVSVIILIIWLIMLNIATSKVLVFASSQVLLVAFIFGNFCKNVFESIIFLFVVHPYDVGDRCEVDAVQMVVEEMNILTTVFLRYDNQKIVFPNFMLLTKPIGNFYRSPDMGDAVEFCFHILTPPEKISLARQRILSYIESKIEHWHPNPMILLKDMESFYTLKIAIWLKHKMNHQDMGERWARRALLVEECVKVFRELDVEYRVLPWNVNIRSMPTLNFGPPSMNAGSAEGGHREMVSR